MTTLQPGESRDFSGEIPAGSEIQRLHAVIHFDPFDEPAIVLAFLGANLAFGWVIGWVLGVLA